MDDTSVSVLLACRYHPAQIVITENGVSVPKEQDMRVADATRDSFRVDYYRWAIGALAIMKGRVCMPCHGVVAGAAACVRQQTLVLLSMPQEQP